MIERIPVLGADGKVDRESWLALRQKDVTASVVAALFGLSPYTTAAELYAEKANGEVRQIDSGVLRRGRLLEGAVAMAVEEDHPEWRLEKAVHYYRDPAVRIGATPDFYVHGDARGLGVIQAKTVAPSVFRKSWADEGVPFWISLQAATEMMLTGANWAAVAALVVDPFRLDCHVYEVPKHPGVEQRIVEAVAKFWEGVEWGEAPAIDYARDGDLIAALHPTAVEMKTIDLTGDNHLPVILAERADLKEQIRVAQERCITIDNEIRDKVGDAEIASLDGFVITNKNVSRKGFEVKPTTFRKLNITETRERDSNAAGPF